MEKMSMKNKSKKVNSSPSISSQQQSDKIIVEKPEENKTLKQDCSTNNFNVDPKSFDTDTTVSAIKPSVLVDKTKSTTGVNIMIATNNQQPPPISQPSKVTTIRVKDFHNKLNKIERTHFYDQSIPCKSTNDITIVQNILDTKRNINRMHDNVDNEGDDSQSPFFTERRCFVGTLLPALPHKSMLINLALFQIMDINQAHLIYTSFIMEKQKTQITTLDGRIRHIDRIKKQKKIKSENRREEKNKDTIAPSKTDTKKNSVADAKECISVNQADQTEVGLQQVDQLDTDENETSKLSAINSDDNDNDDDDIANKGDKNLADSDVKSGDDDASVDIENWDESIGFDKEDTITKRRELYLLGSCLDPYSLLYKWHSPGKRMAVTWWDSVQSSSPNPLKKQNIPSYSINQRQSDQSISSSAVKDKHQSREMLIERNQSFLDPHAVLCPYELAGRCIDLNCRYQHLEDPKKRNPKNWCRNIPSFIIDGFGYSFPSLPVNFMSVDSLSKSSSITNTNYYYNSRSYNTTYLPSLPVSSLPISPSKHTSIATGRNRNKRHMSLTLQSENQNNAGNKNKKLKLVHQSNHPKEESDKSDFNSDKNERGKESDISKIEVSKTSWSGEELDFIAIPLSQHDDTSDSTDTDDDNDDTSSGNSCDSRISCHDSSIREKQEQRIHCRKESVQKDIAQSEKIDTRESQHNKSVNSSSYPFWWWCKIKDMVNQNSLDDDKLVMPCSLFIFLSHCGIDVEVDKNNNNNNDTNSSSTRVISISHRFKHNQESEKDFVGKTLLLQIACIIDCIRLCIFSGRFEIAHALVDMGEQLLSVFSSKTNAKNSVEIQSDVIELIVKPIWSCTSTLVNKSMGSTALQSFCNQRDFILLANLLFGLQNDYTMNLEPEAVQNWLQTWELEASSICNYITLGEEIDRVSQNCNSKQRDKEETIDKILESDDIDRICRDTLSSFRRSLKSIECVNQSNSAQRFHTNNANTDRVGNNESSESCGGDNGQDSKHIRKQLKKSTSISLQGVQSHHVNENGTFTMIANQANNDDMGNNKSDVNRETISNTSNKNKIKHQHAASQVEEEMGSSKSIDGRRRLNDLMTCCSLGSKISKCITHLYNISSNINNDTVFSLTLITHLVEEIWSDVERNFCNSPFNKGMGDDEYDFRSTCGIILFGPIIFTCFHQVLQSMKRNKGEKSESINDIEQKGTTGINNSENDIFFFGIDAKSFTILSKFDGILQRSIKKLHSYSNSNDMGKEDSIIFGRGLSFQMKKEFLLASLISSSVATSILLRMPNKGHIRLERAFSFFSSSFPQNYGTHDRNGMMVFSELLWSQWLTLRMCFPILKVTKSKMTNATSKRKLSDSSKMYEKNMDLISNIVQLADYYNVYMCHLVLPGDSNLLMKQFGKPKKVVKARVACSLIKLGVFTTTVTACLEEKQHIAQSHSFHGEKKKITTSLKRQDIDEIMNTKSSSNSMLTCSLNDISFNISKTIPFSVLLLSDRLIKLSASNCSLSWLPETFGTDLKRLEVSCVSHINFLFSLLTNYIIFYDMPLYVCMLFTSCRMPRSWIYQKTHLFICPLLFVIFQLFRH